MDDDVRSNNPGGVLSDVEEHPSGQVCDGIDDPLRRGLCKVCGNPVLGIAPFCQDHEPPVP